MKRAILLGILVLSAGCSSGEKSGEKNVTRTKEEPFVEFDSLKSKAPESWKQETPTGGKGGLRHYQFRLPRAQGDTTDAELVVFKGIGGSVKNNIDRWKGQFDPPAGKKIDDVAKVEELTVSGCKVVYLDVSGTYMEGPPGLPRESLTPRKDYRMLAAHFEGPRAIYHIKLTGPAATIESHKKEFDEWLKGFK